MAGAALQARYDQISWRAQEKRVIVTWFSPKKEKQYLFFFNARTGRYDPAFSCGAVHILDRKIILCVCACGSVRILDRKKFAVAQADTPFEEESGLQC